MSKRVPTVQEDGTLKEKFMPTYLKTTQVALKADKATTINPGTGLSGGGDLSANRTLAVVFGTTAGTAAQGNDSRLSDARTPLAHTHLLTDMPTVWTKEECRVATTANIALTGTQTIDGIAVVAGDRVLVKEQTTQSQNGIYVVAAGAWSRSIDADSVDDLAGAVVSVVNGTQSGIWMTPLKADAILNTTNVTWASLSDISSTLSTKADKATAIAAGTGLSGGGDLSANRSFAVVYGTAAGTAAQGNDVRLSDARTPLAHTHLIADLPVASSGTSSSSLLVRADDSRLSDARTPTAHVHSTSDVTGLDTALASKALKTTAISAGTGLSGGGDLSANRSFTVVYGTTAGTAAQGNDSRLSDARTPTAHTHPLTDLPGAWTKDNVRVATTVNIALSGLLTVDGVTLVAGDRVLVKNQTTTSQNGIYTVASGAWSRSSDANTAAGLAGSVVAVDTGNTNAGFKFSTNFASSSTLGTNPVVWSKLLQQLNPTLEGVTNIGVLDTDFALKKAVDLETHIRSVTTTYTGGVLTQIVEKSGATTVKTTTLNYTGDVLTSVVEVANGVTVIETITYTAGVFSGITRSVV